MAAITIIAVNQTGSPISFARLNMPDGQIPGSGQVTLTDYNTVVEIQNSSELLTQIQGGNVLLNDGTRTLTQAESERLLSPIALGLGATSAGTILIYDQVTNTLTGSSVSIDAAGNLILGGEGKLSGSLSSSHGFADVVNHTASTLAEVNTLISDATLDTNTASRPAQTHGFADVVRHSASTLAEVNTLISDATLIDTADSRLSDDRDPNLHGLGNSARHSASTLAELNALVSDATLDTNTASRPAQTHGFADVVRHSASTLAEVNSLISDATLDDITGNRTDADAIHDNVSSEISAITAKGTPVANDYLIIEDSAAANVKKSVRWGTITGSGGGLSPHGLADAQYHTASTLAELNSKISDATLIDTADSRLSDDRDPNPHGLGNAARHTASTLAELNALVSDATLDTNTASRPAQTHGFADVVRHSASTLAEVNSLISDATLDTNTASRPAASHGFADVVRHTASTLAEVNSLVSDATLDTNTAERPAASHGFADVARHSASTIAQVNDKVSDGNFVWELSKAVTVQSPTSDEKIAMWRTNKAITITELNAAASGSTPSFTWNIRHGTDKSAAGNAVMSASVTTTSQTAGDKVNTFTSGDPTVPAQSWIWLRITATGGTTDEANVTVFYTVD